ncbi:MAG: hypothetical protein HC853_00275 [Anaerolineae bacterium]|nr:hypothetical protein [Anaerolineae bacterium]
MFEKLTTRIVIAHSNLTDRRNDALRVLNTRLQSGPDLASDQGVDDAVWKIAAVAAVCVLAAGVLLRLRNAVEQKGDEAVGAIGALPTR